MSLFSFVTDDILLMSTSFTSHGYHFFCTHFISILLFFSCFFSSCNFPQFNLFFSPFYDLFHISPLSLYHLNIPLLSSVMSLAPFCLFSSFHVFTFPLNLQLKSHFFVLEVFLLCHFKMRSRTSIRSVQGFLLIYHALLKFSMKWCTVFLVVHSSLNAIFYSAMVVILTL